MTVIKIKQLFLQSPGQAALLLAACYALLSACLLAAVGAKVYGYGLLLAAALLVYSLGSIVLTKLAAECQAAKNQFQSLITHLQDAFSLQEVLLDQHGKPRDYRYLAVNPAFEKITGCYKQDLLGQLATKVMPATVDYWLRNFGKALASGQSVTMQDYVSGKERHYSSLIYCSLPGQLAVLVRDVTAQKQYANTVRRLAYYDKLTGMPNKEYLSSRLQEEIDKAHKEDANVAVLYINLDDMSTVKEVFGHEFGDTVIITAGTYIVAEAGDHSFAARIGYSEFVVLLAQEGDLHAIGNIAETIVKVLSRQCELGESRYDMSASIGVAVYPADGETVGELLKNAAAALHAVQKGGKKGCLFYHHAMQREVYERLMLSQKLRGAADRGEMFLHYQPQINKAGRLSGFEALLRWQQPELGWVRPDIFIAVAEEHHLIQPLGEWVLRAACDFIRKMCQQGVKDICVAVNVSPLQLAALDFVSDVGKVVNEFGILPGQLEFEITETVVMTSLEDNHKKLVSLQKMGIVLSLDDFGTGYSSLTYLQRLPVERLKIDKSFIDLIRVNERKMAIIRSIIDMAHVLALEVVAEGVETIEQQEYLLACGCDIMQGYLYGKAMPAEEALAYAHRGQKERYAITADNS